MYFPYLRAKQFELIALRELLENKLIGENIFPIIEPLKLSPTLIKTMEHYTRENRLLGIVQNPKVGNFWIISMREMRIDFLKHTKKLCVVHILLIVM